MIRAPIIIIKEIIETYASQIANKVRKSFRAKCILSKKGMGDVALQMRMRRDADTRGIKGNGGTSRITVKD